MRKDTFKTWEMRREAGRVRGVSQFVFAVDDSEVETKGVRHTILAAVGFKEPVTAIDGAGRLRSSLGVATNFEFKWHRQFDDPAHRRLISDEFQNILSESIGLVTITEGTDRQQAAELLAVQIADLVEEPVLAIIVFDEGIIRDAAAFRRFVLGAKSETIRRMQVATGRSFANVRGYRPDGDAYCSSSESANDSRILIFRLPRQQLLRLGRAGGSSFSRGRRA